MATPTETATHVVEASIETQWAAGPNTVISWPNRPFTPPDDAAWLKVDFLWGDAFLRTKNGLNTIVGVLQLSLFTPKDAGDGALLSLVESARAMFNRAEVSSVRFNAPSGPRFTTEPKWRVAIVDFPFTYDEIVT